MTNNNCSETWMEMANATKDYPAYHDVFLWMAEKTREVEKK